MRRRGCTGVGAILAIVDRDSLIARISQLVSDARFADVVAVYLFGSRARGDAKATSDVDIGVLQNDVPRTLDDLKLDLEADLERDIRLPVDVVILNGAPSDLVHRVLRDGVLIVERDRSARVRFEVRARNEYFDLQPIRDAYRRGPRGVGV